MLTAHHVNAFLVIGVCMLAAAAAFWARRARAGSSVAQLLALAQTLIVAQVALGLLLLSDHQRAKDQLHYAYGTFALLAVLSPWLYAPDGAAGAVAVVRGRDTRRRRPRRPRLHDGMTPFIRNLAILAGVALVIVVLNQETALVTAAALLRVAFFIVIGVVAYFFWRDFGRREIETWPGRAATVFYAAVGLLVLDIAWYAAIGIAGRDILAFFVVAAVCVYVGVRTWREQQSYS